MKRIMTLLLVATFLLFSALSAPAQTAETEVFGIEIGQVTGYNFNSEDIGVGQLMGLHFGLTENMELGMVFIDGEGPPPANDFNDFAFIRMTYFVQDEYGFQLSTGSADGAMSAGGVGVFTSPFRRTIDDTLTTSLRLALDYLVPDFTNGVDDGIVSVTISGKIGF